MAGDRRVGATVATVVGREEELRVAPAALQAASVAVVFRGEPGIGKTSLRSVRLRRRSLWDEDDVHDVQGSVGLRPGTGHGRLLSSLRAVDLVKHDRPTLNDGHLLNEDVLTVKPRWAARRRL
jgi:MoxR-like ATPase